MHVIVFEATLGMEVKNFGFLFLLNVEQSMCMDGIWTLVSTSRSYIKWLFLGCFTEYRISILNNNEELHNRAVEIRKLWETHK